MSPLPVRSAAPSSSEAPSSSSGSQPEFARSAEGFPVARLDDLVLAMLPGKDGGWSLASAWRVGRSLGALTRGDFTVFESEIADEAAFRARVHETAEHRRELRGLGRQTARAGAGTPWGSSQVATVYADGVVSHSTASHGGFCLSPERNAEVPPPLRAADGCYEEDCAWAAVAIAFPHLFTTFERRCAERIMMNWEPDAFETIFGRELQPGESREKDRRAFEAHHAGDWIVVAARRSDRHPGMTAVVATLGGQRRFGVGERRFLVPSDEYNGNGRGFGFVIDEARHAAVTGHPMASWGRERRRDDGDVRSPSPPRRSRPHGRSATGHAAPARSDRAADRAPAGGRGTAPATPIRGAPARHAARSPHQPAPPSRDAGGASRRTAARDR